MERLFTQTGKWISITPPDNPKDAETKTEHTLSRIRVSVSQRATTDSGTGERKITASATLFFKAGYSAVDGAVTVRGTVRCAAPDGSLHHLEVQLA